MEFHVKFSTEITRDFMEFHGVSIAFYGIPLSLHRQLDVFLYAHMKLPWNSAFSMVMPGGQNIWKLHGDSMESNGISTSMENVICFCSCDMKIPWSISQESRGVSMENFMFSPP